MCAVCKQGVPRENMIYQKGRVFHPLCYEKQGSTFPAIDPDLAQLSAKTRVELVQMRNLKVRSDAGLLLSQQPAEKKSAKTAKKTKPKKAKKSKAKKTKKVKSKKAKKASKKRR